MSSQRNTDEPVITSRTDTDLYKLTMRYAVAQLYPGLPVEYRLFCRSPKANAVLLNLIPQIRENIQHLCTLAFTECELDHLVAEIPFIPESYVRCDLAHSRLSATHITVGSHRGQFFLGVNGPWEHTIEFETPVLAILEELYMDAVIGYSNEWTEASRRLRTKTAWLRSTLRNKHFMDFKFVDMGTRRRRSLSWHRHVLEYMNASDCLREFLAGTSNIMLARELGLKVFGTMAHEWISGHMGIVRPDLAQQRALHAWQEVYHGDLGIALTDTFGTDVFLLDFDRNLSNAYAGVRHDSGDPMVWGNKMINHYRGLGIDPMTRGLVFSNSLNFKSAVDIYSCFHHLTNPSFGIGGFLTNDFLFPRADIVMKLILADGHPVLKLSDDGGKVTCLEPTLQAYMETQLQRRLEDL